MIYVLIAVFVVWGIWGFAALFSLPASGVLMLALGSGVVVIGAVVCAVVALHMLDVGIAKREGNRTFLKRFAEALRHGILDLLVAGMVSVALLLLYYYLRVPTNFVGISTAPIYAVAVKWVLSVRAEKHALAVSWRARTVISTIYVVLMALTLYLLSLAESVQPQVWINVWILVTTGLVAAACYLSAASFRSSVLHGQILRSPTIELIRREIGLPAISQHAGTKRDSRRAQTAPPDSSNRFSGGRAGGAKKRSASDRT